MLSIVNEVDPLIFHFVCFVCDINMYFTIEVTTNIVTHMTTRVRISSCIFIYNNFVRGFYVKHSKTLRGSHNSWFTVYLNNITIVNTKCSFFFFLKNKKCIWRNEIFYTQLKYKWEMKHK